MAPLAKAACLQLLVGLLVALNSLCDAYKDVTFDAPRKSQARALIGSEHEQRVLPSHPQKMQKTGETVLRRSKRRWAPVPTTIMENSLGPFPMQIQQLSSDTAQHYNITYSISGPGVDQPPLNYFYIERETGNLFVTCPIDREEYPEFQIICYARTLDGYTPEIPLVHLIRIEDDNDCPPIFDPVTYSFCIPEHSRSGTIIGQVTATDRDEPGTLHTKLRYRIVSQQPMTSRGSYIFNIVPDTGSITLTSPVLDRETVEEYTILIEARDMGGQPFGLCTTATVTIQVEDSNDHAPMCEHGMYEAYVPENTVGAKVVDIGIVDKDAHGTPAWHATFSIIKGNEDGAFKIEKNPNSNVGTLCTEKGLDYEKNKERRLEIVVNNQVPYSVAPGSRSVATSTCYVTVKVRDVDEGPVFDPCVYILNVKECLPAGTVVGQYLSRDPETGNSEGIRYAVLSDPCGWITIDNGGQIRTTRLLDRDAPEMQFYQCNVTVSATDRSGKTGTGIVVVNLEDENDNFPVIVKKDYIACRGGEPICLTAVDADLYPHTVPFTFDIPDRMVSGWRLMPNDDKSVYLEPLDPTGYGRYTIPVRVTDSGGHGGVSDITVYVCDCIHPDDCRSAPKVPRPAPYPAPGITLGIWAILAMILGSLLLLLILITLCGCWGTAPVSKHVCDDLANQNLIISNTEAPGEEVMDPNILPVKTSDQAAGMTAVGVKTGGQESFEMVKGGGHQALESVQGVGHHTLESVKGGGHHTLESGRGYGQSMMDTYRYSYSDWQNFAHPRLTEKLYMCGQDDEHKHSEDYVLSYNYEGRGSPAGSVGCCTDQQDEEALDFLDQLEPKFRTLAETCVKR